MTSMPPKAPKEQLPNYTYMTILRKIYEKPKQLLCDHTLSNLRKKFLLKRWRDDRTQYILENLRDRDYEQDTEMAELLKMTQIAKAVSKTEDKIDTPIRIVTKSQI